jgi:hypothetical protein
LLAETLRQPLTHQARKDVKRAAGGKGDDHTPAASERLAPKQSTTRPAARQRPLPDAENFGEEVS